MGLGRVETAADEKPGNIGFPDYTSGSKCSTRNKPQPRLHELTVHSSTTKFNTVSRGIKTESGSNLRESSASQKKKKKKYDLRRLKCGTSAADKLVMILDQGIAGSTIYLPSMEI